MYYGKDFVSWCVAEFFFFFIFASYLCVVGRMTKFFFLFGFLLFIVVPCFFLPVGQCGSFCHRFMLVVGEHWKWFLFRCKNHLYPSPLLIIHYTLYHSEKKKKSFVLSILHMFPTLLYYYWVSLTIVVNYYFYLSFSSI